MLRRSSAAMPYSSSSSLRYAAKATAPSLIMTLVHLASLTGVRKLGLRVHTIFELWFHALMMLGPFPTYVVGLVPLSPHLDHMHLRIGMLTERRSSGLYA